jgi:hypothetical protein
MAPALYTSGQLNAVAAAAERKLARGGWSARYADELAHIASDARSAADPEYPCGASLHSVMSYLEGDDDLAWAAESYVPAGAA